MITSLYCTSICSRLSRRQETPEVHTPFTAASRPLSEHNATFCLVNQHFTLLSCGSTVLAEPWPPLLDVTEPCFVFDILQDSVRPAARFQHTQDSTTQRTKKNMHALGGIRSQSPSGQYPSLIRPRHCDGCFHIKLQKTSVF